MEESKAVIKPADKTAATNFIGHMKKYVCFSCSGWGHTKTCYRKTKNKLNNKKAGGCPTNDLIDSLYKIGAIDKSKWKAYVLTKRIVIVPDKRLPPLTAEPSTNGSTTYPTKKRPKLKDDTASLETYFGQLPVPVF